MPIYGPELNKKIDRAMSLIENAAAEMSLCVLCSFGKDSLALLQLQRKMGFEFPVVTFREAWDADKWAHAYELIADWGLEVHFPPPYQTWTYQHGAKFVLGASYPFGRDPEISAAPPVIAIPKDVVEPQTPAISLGGKHCGVRLLNRPTGWMDLPWEGALIGHKDCDRDPILGAIPLKTAHVPPRVEGAMHSFFPLKEWTDADVWEYLRGERVPWDKRRYQDDGSSPPGEFNADYEHACVECMKAVEGGGKAFCPLARQWIDRIETPRLPSLKQDHFEAENTEAA